MSKVFELCPRCCNETKFEFNLCDVCGFHFEFTKEGYLKDGFVVDDGEELELSADEFDGEVEVIVKRKRKRLNSQPRKRRCSKRVAKRTSSV